MDKRNWGPMWAGMYVSGLPVENKGRLAEFNPCV